MDAKTCMEKFQKIGVLNFATIGLDGSPQVRCISAIHYSENEMYFFTAPGKAFYDELIADGRVQILGYTKFKEMIRMSATAKPVDETERKKFIDIIFSEQPYLSNLYSGEKKIYRRHFCNKRRRDRIFQLRCKSYLPRIIHDRKR